MSGRTYKDYRKMFQSLLPVGKFWTRSESSTLTEMLDGFGGEPARLEGRCLDLIDESVPSKVTELLEEWETDFDLPDEGQEIGATTAARRADIKAKFIARGEQNKEYFEEIASELGYTITITEIEKSLAGLLEIGEGFITPERIVFYWFVNIDVTENMLQYYDMVNISQLIIEISTRKPAHTIVLYRFTGVEFDRSFDSAFDCIPWYDGSSWPISFSRDFSNAFANAYDYDGVRLTGSFDSQFSIAFDSYQGGEFEFNEFGDGFRKPN